MADKNERRPVDQLVDLFVYAPVGLVYEYQDVLPKLIKRGKSQVQIARFLGTMAAKQGQKTVEGRLEEAFGAASSTMAQGITDVGARVGLAPDPAAQRRAAGNDASTAATTDTGAGAKTIADQPASKTDTRPLAIAGYDELTAKQIVALVPDLTPSQRQRVADYEAANRARKTVLAKLRALAEDG